MARLVASVLITLVIAVAAGCPECRSLTDCPTGTACGADHRCAPLPPTRAVRDAGAAGDAGAVDGEGVDGGRPLPVDGGAIDGGPIIGPPDAGVVVAGPPDAGYVVVGPGTEPGCTIVNDPHCPGCRLELCPDAGIPVRPGGCDRPTPLTVACGPDGADDCLRCDNDLTCGPDETCACGGGFNGAPHPVCGSGWYCVPPCRPGPCVDDGDCGANESCQTTSAGRECCAPCT